MRKPFECQLRNARKVSSNFRFISQDLKIHYLDEKDIELYHSAVKQKYLTVEKEPQETESSIGKASRPHSVQ